MAEKQVRRWTVTYTKHLKQKRKVYQDGYVLLPSNKKVMLYDESDKLLDSKFLKEDENLTSGESITFGSYLVDIGDSEIAEFAQEEKTKKSSDRNCNPGRQKLSAINISPSQRIIREFKKNENIKSALQERSPSSATSEAGEWQAMYTTQLTQKAKKYHDGFIKLVLCGSQGRQAKLYDESKTLLDSRFLKKDQIISSGESLKFDGYLIDIGDPVNREKLVEVKAEGQNRNTAEVNRGVSINQIQLSSFKNGGSDLKSRKLSQSYVSAHQLLKKGNPSLNTVSENHVEHRMNSSGADTNRVALTGSRVPSMPLSCGTPRDACQGKDVEQRVNAGGTDASRVRLTESRAPNMSLRGADEILSFLKKPTSPRSTSGTDQVPEKQSFPSPDLVILDSDYKERPEKQSIPSPDLVILDSDYKKRSEVIAQRNFNQLKKQGTEESEDQVTHYEGLTQSISRTEEGDEPTLIPFDISRKIKVEKDCDDKICISHKVSTTNCNIEPVISSPDFTFSSSTQSRHSHKGLNEVKEVPKSVNRAFGINHPFKINSTKVKKSSTKMDECPSFDLGF